MSLMEKKAGSVLEPKKTDLYFKSFIAGGVACMCSKSAVAPLDRIKILFQAHNQHYKHLVSWQCRSSIMLVGVVWGCYSMHHIADYRAATPSLWLICCMESDGFSYLLSSGLAGTSIIFRMTASANSNCSSLFSHLPTTVMLVIKNTFGPSHASKFFAGSAAGVTASIMTYPLDVVRARLAFQVTGEHVYSGICNTLSLMFRREGGISALYKGLSPTILAKIPSAGLSFYVFERSKALLLEYRPELCGRSHSSSSGGIVLTLPAKLFCGGLAGGIAQTVSYPLDVARRKMQLGTMTAETQKFGRGLVEILVLTYKKDGIANGLFRGMTINYLRVVPMMAVSLSTYELGKQIFGLDTGIDS
ncbi:solute carrier family 25 member 16 [Parasteatoda tepidariorum]|uniref:solute carrier family 25 member 16 n=1 Tax=Parasteatoda tepidariorum TaxID=114398 RepID=UPI0039BD6D7B